MFAPLIQSLIDRHGWPVVTPETLDAFLARDGEVALFFSGDAGRLEESGDVAVVLPEILKVFGGRLAAGVVERAFERELQRRYRFSAFPALVFLRGGDYLGAIARMKDWDVYLSEIAEILSREPSEPPPFKLPNGSAARALQ